MENNFILIDFEESIELSTGNSATVHAMNTNLDRGATPLPDPSTMLFIGAGLISLVGLG